MTRRAYIFTDFDGVTHPWGEVEDFRCLPLIEGVVREYPESRIVIASDWRMLFSMQKLLARFSSDVHPQIAGATPHMLPKNGAELHGLREREAMIWLSQHEPNLRDVAWCAIDDAPGNWFYSVAADPDRLQARLYRRGCGCSAPDARGLPQRQHAAARH
ncbi:HAD domain-containing protein [Thauera mechernichensis]